MQKIKPAEVSALLKKQLESADIQSSFDEIGTVDDCLFNRTFNDN